MRHARPPSTPLLDYAPADERWSPSEVAEMLGGLAALAFIGFGLLCLVYTLELGAVLLRAVVQS